MNTEYLYGLLLRPSSDTDYPRQCLLVNRQGAISFVFGNTKADLISRLRYFVPSLFLVRCDKATTAQIELFRKIPTRPRTPEELMLFLDRIQRFGMEVYRTPASVLQEV